MDVLNFNFKTTMFDNCPDYISAGRVLKTRFGDNSERFKKQFLEPFYTWLSMNDVENKKDITDFYKELYNTTKPISFEEAFRIEDENFKRLVFSNINVPEMVESLGHKLIKADGIELVNKTYLEVEKAFKNVEFTQIYELHKVYGEKLGLDDLYALKCWCTSTKEEHWLWVSEEVAAKKDPLEAIASLCRIWKPMLGKIKHIIRQGDVFLFEMNEKVHIDGSEGIVGLNKKEYFNLLKSQS